MSNTRKFTYLRVIPTKTQGHAITIKKAMRYIKSTRKKCEHNVSTFRSLCWVRNTVREIRNNAEKLQKESVHEIKLVLLEFLTQQVPLWNSIKRLGVHRPRITPDATLYPPY
jgi:hypothetical protein